METTVSKGPWKKKAAPQDADPGHIVEVAHWQDRRCKERAKAKAATDAAYAGAVAALAQKSRADARSRRAPRYIGTPCPRHDSAERYTASGQCIYCDREVTAARRGAPQIFGTLRGSVHSARPRTSHRPQFFTRGKAKLEGAAPILELDAE